MSTVSCPFCNAQVDADLPHECPRKPTDSLGKTLFFGRVSPKEEDDSDTHTWRLWLSHAIAMTVGLFFGWLLASTIWHLEHKADSLQHTLVVGVTSNRSTVVLIDGTAIWTNTPSMDPKDWHLTNNSFWE